MATTSITKGRTFVSGETVTPAKLNDLVDNATVSISAIQTADISDSQVTTAKIADASSTTTGVTNSKLRHSAALSVIGNTTNAAAAPSDIAASNDGEVLRRSGTAVGFGTVATTGIAAAAITAPKLSGAQTGSAPIFGCRAWVSFDGTFTAVTSNSYSRSGTTVTVTKTSHGLSTGNRLAISSATDTGLNTANATTASAEITVTDANTFTFQTASTGTASGTLTYARGIRGAGNVSSVERTATGVYLITFTTAMPDTNYALAGFAGQENVNAGRIVSQNNTFSPSTSSCEVRTSNSGNAAETNVPFVSVIFIR